MTLFDFFRLIYRNLGLLYIVPIIMGATIFLLTMNEPKTYKSSALVYTGLASGYNIESGAGDKVDYHSVNAAYDNLMSLIDSRFTLEEVGLRLLALNLTQKKPGLILGEKAFKLLEEVVPLDMRQDFVVDDNAEKTYQNLQLLFNEGHPLIDQLIKGNSSYSVEKLRSVSVKRIKSSDMIELTYESYDPGLCRNTLSLLLDVFTTRFKGVKESETGNVIAYFEHELTKVKGNLEAAENKLTDYKVKSRVINYSEETKALAIKKQNALEEYALRKMNLKETEAALNELEEKLQLHKEQLKNNQSLIESKNNLSKITTEIAFLETNHAADSLIVIKYIQQENIKSQLENRMSHMINMTATPEGISANQMISDWLDNLIQYNRDLVGVTLFKNRLKDIDTQYDNFTPMGSTIDRLERQISIYEREYLEVLHGLNLSKLRQQNIELTSDLKIMDKPSFPLDPEASKRVLFVVAGLFIGFAGTLSFLVAIDLLDLTLRKPENAKKKTGLEVVGAIPVINKETEQKYSSLVPRLTGLITSRITMEKYFSKATKQELIITLSVSKGEGKSTVTHLLFEEFLAAGVEALWIRPEPETAELEPEDERPHVIRYKPDRKFKSLGSIQELTGDRDLSTYRYIFMEIPPLNEGMIPIHIIEKSNISLIIARSDKGWLTAHKTLVSDYGKLAGKEPMMILNGVKLFHLDQILGEVPLVRSKFIKWVRSVVRFELSKSSFKSA